MAGREGKSHPPAQPLASAPSVAHLQWPRVRRSNWSHLSRSPTRSCLRLGVLQVPADVYTGQQRGWCVATNDVQSFTARRLLAYFTNTSRGSDVSRRYTWSRELVGQSEHPSDERLQLGPLAARVQSGPEVGLVNQPNPSTCAASCSESTVRRTMRLHFSATICLGVRHIVDRLSRRGVGRRGLDDWTRAVDALLHAGVVPGSCSTLVLARVSAARRGRAPSVRRVRRRSPRSLCGSGCPVRARSG